MFSINIRKIRLYAITRIIEKLELSSKNAVQKNKLNKFNLSELIKALIKVIYKVKIKTKK